MIMDPIHILTKRKIKRRYKKPLKDSSIVNVSKSVINELSNENPILRSNSNPLFIPFHNERDGLGRIIKGASKTLNKTITKAKISTEKLIKSKKLILRQPINYGLPSVGSYNINTT
jgi:hypothetical protein